MYLTANVGNTGARAIAVSKLIKGINMKKLEEMESPTVMGAFMAKTKFKLDGIRYRGKLRANQWNHYEAN